MILLKKLLSSWLLPPAGLLLAAFLTLCFGKGRSSRLIGCGLVLITLSLFLPWVADLIESPLEGVPIDLIATKSAQAIVILGGGVHYGAPEYGGDTLGKYSLERVRYGAKLARESKLPILVSGGSVLGGEPEAKLMRQVLESEFGVTVRWEEASSRDTNENAIESALMLRQAGIQNILLVTHAWHMRRARAAFERQGIRVVPTPTGFASRGYSLFERLLPSTGAFERSTIAIHEWAGLALTW